MGFSVSTSNSTLAFSNLEFSYFKIFNSPKCVVQTHKIFFLDKYSSMARARAEPSSGSVPAPNSSKSTREFSVAFSIIVEMFLMCALKVERL